MDEFIAIDCKSKERNMEWTSEIITIHVCSINKYFMTS